MDKKRTGQQLYGLIRCCYADFHAPPVDIRYRINQALNKLVKKVGETRAYALSAKWHKELADRMEDSWDI